MTQLRCEPASPNGEEDDSPIDEIIELDRRRRTLIQQTDSARHFRNDVSRTIGSEKRRPTEDEIQQMRATGDRISALEEEARSVAAELRALMLGLPNIPLCDVPEGLDESLNVVVREEEPPRAREWDTPHWDIGENLGIIDMESAGEYFGQQVLHVARARSPTSSSDRRVVAGYVG